MFNIFSSPAKLLENNKEKFFTEFQKMNRPSGLEYVREHTVDYLFDALKDMVLDSNEDSKIFVKSIEAEIVDLEGAGKGKIGSVHYQAIISVDGNEESIDEVWHFQYSGLNWKLAGIEQVGVEEEIAA